MTRKHIRTHRLINGDWRYVFEVTPQDMACFPKGSVLNARARLLLDDIDGVLDQIKMHGTDCLPVTDWLGHLIDVPSSSDATVDKQSNIENVPEPSDQDHELAMFEHDADAIFTDLLDVLVSKQKDYGPGNIANAPGGALNGLIVRINDKVERIKNLHYGDQKPENEAIEDSFIDLANYAVIGLMLLKGQWPGQKASGK